MVKTRQIVERMLKLDPRMSYSAIGEMAGVSKQRVQQITKHYNLFKDNTWDKTSKQCMGDCGRRLNNKKNKSGWCRACSLKAHGYEMRCAEPTCKKIRVFYGAEASNRRNNATKKKTNLDFCTTVCSGKYFRRIALEKGAVNGRSTA